MLYDRLSVWLQCVHDLLQHPGFFEPAELSMLNEWYEDRMSPEEAAECMRVYWELADA